MKTAIQRIDAHNQRGWGKAAAKLGQTYDIYRLINQNTSIVSGTPIMTGFPAHWVKSQKREVENQIFDLFAVSVYCDSRPLDLFDVAVETGYGAEEGDVFIVAQKRPRHKAIWVRCEAYISITRPATQAGASTQQPTQGSVITPGWGGTYKANEKVLTLTSGTYAFVAGAPTPASIPCGLQPLNRIRDGQLPRGLPTRFYREHYVAYLPLLPGEIIREEDILNFPNEDRYEVALVYTSVDTGLSGYILVVEKLGV